MEAKNIKSLNTAVYVMRHFVELSAKLLPIYEKITRDEPHSIYSEDNKKQIEMIYQGYDVNPKVSEFLLGSDILALIRKTYGEFTYRTKGNEKTAQETIEALESEYERLKQDWYVTMTY